MSVNWKDMEISSRHGDRLAASVGSSEGKVPNKGWVLMMPGFTSKRINKTADSLAERLAIRGIICVALDLSGHGDSTGSIGKQTIQRAADEIEDAVSHLRGLQWSHELKMGIFGSSFSGSAAIITASRIADLACLALKSPVPDYSNMRRATLGEEAMNQWKQKGVYEVPSGVVSDYQFITDAERYDLVSLAALLNVPCLVVQGENDEEIPRSDWTRLQSVVRDDDREFVVIPGGDHGYTDSRVFDKMLDVSEHFLERHLG